MPLLVILSFFLLPSERKELMDLVFFFDSVFGTGGGGGSSDSFSSIAALSGTGMECDAGGLLAGIKS